MRGVGGAGVAGEGRRKKRRRHGKAEKEGAKAGARNEPSLDGEKGPSRDRHRGREGERERERELGFYPSDEESTDDEKLG